MHLDLGHVQSGGVERADDVGQVGLLLAAHRDRQRVAGGGRAEVAEKLLDRLVLIRIGGGHLDGRPPDGRLELIGRSLGDDVPAVDDPDAVGEHVRLFEVLRRQEDRDALGLREASDLAPERGAALRVEPGRRLVEEQGARLVNQRERQVETALHPARVALDLAVGGSRQPDPFEQLRRCGASVRRGESPCSEAWSRRCSRPVRNGSSAASCSAAPIEARTCGPCLTMS